MSLKRKMPFTIYERELIKELVSEVAYIVESKKTDSDFNKKKNEMWKRITEKFNSDPLCQNATYQQIKKLWLNLKAKARDAKSNERQRFHTGGGAYVPDMSQEDDAVLSIVPHIMPTIKVMKDSDGNPDIDGEDDDLGWMPIEKRPRMSSIDTPFETTHPSTPHTVTTHTATAFITAKKPASPQATNPYPGIPLIKIKRTAIKHPVTMHPVNAHTVTTHTATALSQVVNTPITHTVTTHTATAHTGTTSHTATTHPATTTTSSSTAKPKHYTKTKQLSNIDILKSELIQINIDYHKNKYDQDLAHQKNTNNLSYKILLLEYETKLLEKQHKIKMFNLLEAEQEAKLKLDED